MTDCRPISLFSLQTARQLGEEVGAVLDKRRFRANVYLDLGTGSGFSENEFVGRKLRIGSQVVVSILDRDPRCQMITLDPDTTAADPEVLRRVARGHDGTAGVYGAVLAEGTIRAEDPSKFSTEPWRGKWPIRFTSALAVYDALGSLAGCFIASILMGMVQTFSVVFDYSFADALKPFGVTLAANDLLGEILTIPMSRIGPLVPYALLILILVFRPRGLMGTRET